MSYQAHFFDFDHTLFDSDASEALAFHHALESTGVTSADDTETITRLFQSYTAINRRLWNDVEANRRNPNEVRELRFVRLTAEAEIDVDPRSLAAAFTHGMQEFGDLYPGAAEVVRTLAERGPVALVTNAISEIQRRRIERVGLDGHLDAIVISSEVGVSKPSPAIFEHAFDQLDPLDRSATLMVGDSLTSDMAGGLAAGLPTCWYNPNGTAGDGAIAHHHEIRQLDELLDL
jgi:YjjG family noncanonical pyrimidine nucleotidase